MKTKRHDVVYDISREYGGARREQVRGLVWAEEVPFGVIVKDAEPEHRTSALAMNWRQNDRS